jgi:hypothetical protein
MSKINFQDDQDLFGRLFVFTNDPIFHQLRNAANITSVDLNDAFSWGQLKSKRWLVDELEKLNLELGTVFLCAGWYATLAAMLFNSSCKIDKIRSFDIDLNCESIADTVNANYVKDSWKFKAITQDIFDIDYSQHSWQTWSKANNRMSRLITDQPSTIINTSCEHIEDFDIWYKKIPSGKIVVLQTNNYFEISDHINCSESIEAFSAQTPMSTELFSGELNLTKYTRYMRIGVK